MNTAAWLVIAVILFFFEAITVSLVCIWFCFGALGAFALSLFTTNILIQLIAFVVVTALSFALVKPFFKKFKSQANTENSTSRLIGKTVKVVDEITESSGRVIAGDVTWMAKSSDVIKVGTMVKITDIKSNTLIVERL